MSSFDPELVVQQVWRGDYPASWRVFLGREEANVFNAFLLPLLILISTVFACITITFTASFIFEIGRQGGLSNPGDYIGVFAIIGVIGMIIALIVLGFRAINRARTRRPKPLIVIMPEGVVGYRRKQTWAIAFADIAHIQLRAQANDSRMPILIDLIYQGGQRREWFIDIAPQEMIAQCVLEAHTAFRLHHAH